MTQKEKIKAYFDGIAEKRDQWKKRNKQYHQAIAHIVKFFVPPQSVVLDIGSSTGDLLHAVDARDGLGIDISENMVAIAQHKYPQLHFQVMDAERISLDKKFDYILCANLPGYLTDVQVAFSEFKKVSHDHTKVFVAYYNYLWEPLLKLGEFLHLKMSSPIQNWLSQHDIEHMLSLAGFEMVRRGEEFLFPLRIPLITGFINRFIAKLPLLRRLCLIKYVIAKPIQKQPHEYTVSVLIPARNEKGNIENAITRLPQLGKHTEIIFVEGGSKDGTPEEIQRVIKAYPEKDIQYLAQKGNGKGDAVRTGFHVAQGDVLMILDADLTVSPEDLPKFYDAIASGKGEFINGSRLVYQLEDEAMRPLNLLGNKFFGTMFSWILGQRLKDTLCGTKVLFKKDYEKIVANRKFFGDFDPFGDFDLIFGATKLGLKIIDLPIRYKARTYGDTNISRWKHGWLLLQMTWFAMFKIKFIQ
ncbi:MAG: glycosyltransferase [bacterium]|nr:glycosyltransferase [bacterium]